MQAKVATHRSPIDPTQEVTVCEVKTTGGDRFYHVEMSTTYKHDEFMLRIPARYQMNARELAEHLSDKIEAEYNTEERFFDGSLVGIPERGEEANRWLVYWPEFFPTVKLVLLENKATGARAWIFRNA